jgi:hypothetical protein
VAQGKKLEKTVNIEFLPDAQEHKFYNRFRLGIEEGLIFVTLAFADRFSEVVVFTGVIAVSDCSTFLAGTKDYIGKIGGPGTDKIPELKDPQTKVAPASFHHMGLMSRDDVGEVTIGQFGLKAAWEAARLGKDKVSGKTYGCYVAPLAVHKQFVYQFVQLAEGGKA